MKVVIGGCAQGKLDYVLQHGERESFLIFDGRLPGKEEIQESRAQKKIVVINHFHQWMREIFLQGQNPEALLSDFMKDVPDAVVISDETGNGIVPADALERACREQTGRMLVKLAGHADEVVRVICGIGQRIK